MTRDELRDLVNSWIQDDSDKLIDYFKIRSLTNFLEDILYNEYSPTKVGNHGFFNSRLAKWIASAETEEQKKILYAMLAHIYFVGQKEMDALHATAYSKHLISWILKTSDISVFDVNAKELIEQELNATLFTAMTDSFPLADFIRLNNIHGTKRPNWLQALDNWDTNNFKDKYLKQKSRIVLFEDFVGSGVQITPIIDTIINELIADYEVLLCPMIILPQGAKLARTFEVKHEKFTFSPVLEISEKYILTEDFQLGEFEDFEKFRKLANDLHWKVEGSLGSWNQNHGPFGFNGGGFIVKSDNCPDNTLPLVHRKSDTGWEPLFYRNSREPL